MKFSVSDLPFGSFSKAFLKALPMQYDIEIFYEFGTDHYWDYVLKDLKSRDGAERRFSIHGPCVAVNLADPNDTAYLEVYEKTFAYAAKINAALLLYTATKHGILPEKNWPCRSLYAAALKNCCSWQANTA